MNIVSTKVHGVLDYGTVLLLEGIGFFGPFSSYVSRLAIALGVVHLVLTVLSNFELGIVKVIPMKIHGYIELAVSIILVPAPLLLGYSDESPAKYFTWVFAVVVFALYVLTDYKGKAR
jgi:hypothetical protein